MATIPFSLIKGLACVMSDKVFFSVPFCSFDYHASYNFYVQVGGNYVQLDDSFCPSKA